MLHPFDEPIELPRSELVARLGGKGAFLADASTRLGLPVPPGFTIPTNVCRAIMDGARPPGLDSAIASQVVRLEARLGRRLGDRERPLLLSVRSGAPKSMPGMLDTVLNLGMNEAVAEALAYERGDANFATDTYFRFVAGFSSTVLGAGGAVAALRADPRHRDPRWLRSTLTARLGRSVPDDARVQLAMAIDAVLASWNSARARRFREHEGIADDLGTAVIVQAMVFGNLDANSATGIAFSRNPLSGSPQLSGEVLFRAQGEDVVSGSHQLEPIDVLARRLPKVYEALSRHTATLERHFAALCEIEFTVEAGRLWILQGRPAAVAPAAALRIAVDMANDPTFPLNKGEAVARTRAVLDEAAGVTRADGGRILARGIAASPGAVGGPIYLTADAAAAAADRGERPVLVRPTTSPDDVCGIARSAALLTLAGGFASHAAVVARAWHLPAVVGAGEIELLEDGIRAGGIVLRAGDIIVVDGSDGTVRLNAEIRQLPGGAEREKLLQWARQVGTSVSIPTAPAAGPASRIDCLRALSLKGVVPTATVAAAIGDDAAAVERLLADAVTAGLVQQLSRGWMLTETGRAAVATHYAEARAQAVPELLSAAINEFGSLDRRLKALVAEWQARPGNADSDGHAQVRGELATLKDTVAILLAPLQAAFPPLAAYRVRLAYAVAAVERGEARWVASPLVDSYHTVWFELHEELLRLCGKQRAE